MTMVACRSKEQLMVLGSGAGRSSWEQGRNPRNTLPHAPSQGLPPTANAAITTNRPPPPSPRTDTTTHRFRYPEDPGRDGCRTPIPWVHDAPNAGFMLAPPGGGAPNAPWLPIPPEHIALAVDVQARCPLLRLSSALCLQKNPPRTPPHVHPRATFGAHPTLTPILNQLRGKLFALMCLLSRQFDAWAGAGVEI
jgi:hypothetical protein